jgi:acyl-CoA synthetase (AMP-forming)/AMP-acid ligase II
MPKMNSWGFERQVEMRCKAGRPIPLAQIRIVDGKMNDLPHDGKTSGELVARAPWLTQGYLKDPKSSEKHDATAGRDFNCGQSNFPSSGALRAGKSNPTQEF